MSCVLVVGAHHGVGALTVVELQNAGHVVKAFEQDVLDARAVVVAVNGTDAVVSLLGPRAHSPADLCARGTQHIVDAMRDAGSRRLVQVTGAIIGHPRQHLGWFYRMIESRVPQQALRDRREQERIVMASGLDWTLLRPTRLTNGPKTERWHTEETRKVGAFARIARADVATQIVRALADPSTIGARLTLQA